jgi:transposase InsO family protein
MARDTTLSCRCGARTKIELTQAILALGVKYGRYGYRRITALLQDAGWPVGKDRVQRIWRREGLKVPQKQRPRGRLWLGDGSCVRLRPERANHVWSYDFVKAMTHDGRALRVLVVIDEYTRECLALRVARRLGSLQVIDTLADVMLVRGIPRAHSFGQWAGVYCRGVAEVARQSGHEDVVHRAWESVGERVL